MTYGAGARRATPRSADQWIHQDLASGQCASLCFGDRRAPIESSPIPPRSRTSWPCCDPRVAGRVDHPPRLAHLLGRSDPLSRRFDSASRPACFPDPPTPRAKRPSLRARSIRPARPSITQLFFQRLYSFREHSRARITVRIPGIMPSTNSCNQRFLICACSIPLSSSASWTGAPPPAAVAELESAYSPSLLRLRREARPESPSTPAAAHPPRSILAALRAPSVYAGGATV